MDQRFSLLWVIQTRVRLVAEVEPQMLSCIWGIRRVAPYVPVESGSGTRMTGIVCDLCFAFGFTAERPR